MSKYMGGEQAELTMLIHVRIGDESVCKEAIKDAPMKGNHPKMKLIVLYLPVRCIM